MLKTLFTAVVLILGVGCNASSPDPVVFDDTHTEIESTSVGFLLLEECSFGIGDNACNFQLRDQNNNLWRLSTHIGDLVLIDLSAMWCGPCQHAATTAQHIQDLYEAQGFHYVTILIDDEQGLPVEIPDLSLWSTNFGITSAPVLQGSRDMLQSGGPSYGFPVTSWPTFIIINRNQEVVWGMRGFNEITLVEAIETYL
tara:strand:+ start:203 stop:796 length:594 start_codon:yes stop_codon:yes gene_type:complete